MRRLFLPLMPVITSFSTAPASAEPVVLQPSAPWAVDFGVDKCRLTRVFGEGENQHLLAFQQYWPASDTGLTVAGPALATFRSLDRTDVRFFATQKPFRTTPFTGSVQGFGSGVIFSSIDIAVGEPEASSGDEPAATALPQLDLETGSKVEFLELRQGGRLVRLKTGPLDAAFKVLNQCTQDLLRDWGLDVERHRTASAAPRWINQAALVRKIVSDYPARAAAQGEQAIMRMRIVVSAEGGVESCTIVKATDTKRLESDACKVMQGAKFEPARDAVGQPMRSIFATSITYRID